VSDPIFQSDREDYAEALPPEVAGRLFERLATQTLDAPPSRRERLRQLRTPVRLLVVLLWTSLGLLLTLLSCGPRVDLSGWAHLLPGLGAALGALALAAALSVVGPHRPWGSKHVLAAVAVLLAPLGLSLLGWPGEPLPGAPPPWQTSCFWIAAGTATLVVPGPLLVDRTERPLRTRVLAMAALGGLTAFAALKIHCPLNDVWHLLSAHSVAGLLVAAALLARGVVRGRFLGAG